MLTPYMLRRKNAETLLAQERWIGFGRRKPAVVYCWYEVHIGAVADSAKHPDVIDATTFPRTKEYDEATLIAMLKKSACDVNVGNPWMYVAVREKTFRILAQDQSNAFPVSVQRGSMRLRLQC